MTYYCGRLKAILSFWAITNRINNDDTTLYAYVTEVYPEGRDKQQPWKDRTTFFWQGDGVASVYSSVGVIEFGEWY